MASKAKRPTLGERLVRVKDLIPFITLTRTRLDALEQRVVALEPPKEPDA